MSKINNDISNMVTNIIATIEEKHKIKFDSNSVVKIITDEMQNHNFIYTQYNLSYNICCIDKVYYITGLTYTFDWINEAVSVIKEKNKIFKSLESNKIYVDLLLKNGINQRFYEIILNDNSVFGYDLKFISNKFMLDKDILQFDKFFKYRTNRIKDSYVLFDKECYLEYLKTL